MTGTGAVEPMLSKYLALWARLTPRFRWAALLLLFATVGGAMLEVLGLSLVAALMSMLTAGPGAGLGQSSLTAIAERLVIPLGEGGAERLIVLCAIVFTFKNLFMGGVAWLEATFAFRLQAYLSDLALRTTLRSKYEQVTRKPPAEHLNLLTTDLNSLIVHLALPTLTLVSEAILMAAVVGFLAWAEPMLTVAAVAVIGAAAFVMMRMSRNVMATLGQKRQRIDDERMRRLREVFTHLREVYVYRASAQFTQHLDTVTHEVAYVYRSFQMLSTGPRFILELVLVGFLLSAILVGLNGEGRQALIVSVSTFAASGFRLLIGANRLIMSAQAIRFAQPALTRMLAATDAAASATSLDRGKDVEVAAQASSLALHDVEFRYPGSEHAVLHGVTIETTRGRIVGIKGGSGSGKTSLLEIMAGLREPSSGAVLLDGRPLADAATELFHLVGYVGQTPAVFSDTVRRNIAYGCPDSKIDDARIWSALEKVQLADVVRALPGQLDAQLGGGALNLSGGQAQRLALARALYIRCRFLLLDEPTSALDPVTEAQVMSTLCSLKGEYAMLLVSHRPRPLDACDVVYEMRKGELVLVTT